MTAWSLIGLLSAMIAMKLSHFQALVVFALVISIAFGFLGRRRPIDRVKYALASRDNRLWTACFTTRLPPQLSPQPPSRLSQLA